MNNNFKYKVTFYFGNSTKTITSHISEEGLLNLKKNSFDEVFYICGTVLSHKINMKQVIMIEIENIK